MQLVVKTTGQQRVLRVTPDGGRVDDLKPHFIALRADNSRGTIQLDESPQRSFTIASRATVDSSSTTTSSSSTIHLGSSAHSSDTPARRPYLSPNGYVGCIQVSTPSLRTCLHMRRQNVTCDRNRAGLSTVQLSINSGLAALSRETPPVQLLVRWRDGAAMPFEFSPFLLHVRFCHTFRQSLRALTAGRHERHGDLKILKACVFMGNPMAELRSVTCHVRSQCVICNLTQVNVFRFNLCGTPFTYLEGIES